MRAPQRDVGVAEFTELSSLCAAPNIDHLGGQKNWLTASADTEQQSIEKAIPLPRTEADIRALVTLFHLLDDWDRSHSNRT